MDSQPASSGPGGGGTAPESTRPPGPGYPAAGGPGEEQGNGVAVAALVVGIAAVVLGLVLFPLFPLWGILGIVAIVLGVVGRRRVTSGRTARGKGLATAGLVLGVLGVLIAVVLLVLTVFLVGTITGDPDLQRQFEQELQRQQELQR